MGSIKLPRRINSRKPAVQIAICVRNEGYPAALELHKAYKVISDSQAAEHHLLRVVDESGEDYLYPEEYFIVMPLSQVAQKAFFVETEEVNSNGKE